MHSKRKGIIGELEVAAYLAKQNLPVFKELGDLSPVDLITIVERVPWRIQVKALTAVKGVVHVSSKKSGPNYSFTYQEEDVDVFAIYVLDTEIIFFVSSCELLKNSSSNFRVTPTKNCQKKGIRYVGDYMDFRRALRGHTRGPSSCDEGEEMVQTTTAVCSSCGHGKP